MYLVAHFTLINESRHFTDFKIFYSLNYFSKNDNVIALKLYLDFIGRHVIPVMRALTELNFYFFNFVYQRIPVPNKYIHNCNVRENGWGSKIYTIKTKKPSRIRNKLK